MIIICDYCDQPAKWMSTLTSNEPLCTRCARDHSIAGDDWRDTVRKIGKRDLAMAEALGLSTVTDALIARTAEAVAGSGWGGWD